MNFRFCWQNQTESLPGWNFLPNHELLPTPFQPVLTSDRISVGVENTYLRVMLPIPVVHVEQPAGLRFMPSMPTSSHAFRYLGMRYLRLSLWMLKEIPFPLPSLPTDCLRSIKTGASWTIEDWWQICIVWHKRGLIRVTPTWFCCTIQPPCLGVAMHRVRKWTMYQCWASYDGASGRLKPRTGGNSGVSSGLCRSLFSYANISLGRCSGPILEFNRDLWIAYDD